MACEDFPCCGHELGCCPSFNENGEQVDMVCVCGKRLPISRKSSICDGCLRAMNTDDFPDYYGDEDGDDYGDEDGGEDGDDYGGDYYSEEDDYYGDVDNGDGDGDDK